MAEKVRIVITEDTVVDDVDRFVGVDDYVETKKKTAEYLVSIKKAKLYDPKEKKKTAK